MNIIKSNELQGLEKQEKNMVDINKEQDNFLETTLGKVINSAIDFRNIDVSSGLN